MKWFNNPKTLEELKKQYKTLAFIHHPDKETGNLEIMKAINNEYDALFPQLKDTHRAANGETYTSSKQSSETPEQFRDIISAIIHFQNVVIEIIGNWIWVSGLGTYSYRDILKANKFKWSKNKSAWYFHLEGYKKWSNKTMSLDEIRSMYGTQSVETQRQEQLA